MANRNPGRDKDSRVMRRRNWRVILAGLGVVVALLFAQLMQRGGTERELEDGVTYKIIRPGNEVSTPRPAEAAIEEASAAPRGID